MLWDINQVVKETSLSKSTIYRLIKDGDFIQPIKISKRRRAWVSDAVRAWVASR
jgi:prophage regulatory protein